MIHSLSVSVFGFIDYILSRPRNNPVYHFELSTEIEVWLRDQWAGLFRELIRSRTDRAQISSLAEQVSDLTNVSSTLKRYLEEVVAGVLGNKQEAKEIIDEEDAKLATSRVLADLAKLSAISDLKQFDVSTEVARDAFAEATSLDDLARRVETATKGQVRAENVISYWKVSRDKAENMNAVREVLNLIPLTFEDELHVKRGSRKPSKRAAKSNQ